jgi:hypothetical protein
MLGLWLGSVAVLCAVEKFLDDRGLQREQPCRTVGDLCASRRPGLSRSLSDGESEDVRLSRGALLDQAPLLVIHTIEPNDLTAASASDLRSTAFVLRLLTGLAGAPRPALPKASRSLLS